MMKDKVRDLIIEFNATPSGKFEHGFKINADDLPIFLDRLETIIDETIDTVLEDETKTRIEKLLPDAQTETRFGFEIGWNKCLETIREKIAGVESSADGDVSEEPTEPIPPTGTEGIEVS